MDTNKSVQKEDKTTDIFFYIFAGSLALGMAYTIGFVIYSIFN